MGKQMKTSTGNNPLGSVMMVGLIIAGSGLILWGTSQLFSERTDALSQFSLSALLGSALIWFGHIAIRTQLAQRTKTAWLERHGTWITAVPIDVRTIKTDAARRTESYCLVLEPTELEKERHGLGGLTFETGEIFARSVPDDYRNLEIDVVIDPDRPGEVHFVSFDAQDLWTASH